MFLILRQDLRAGDRKLPDLQRLREWNGVEEVLLLQSAVFDPAILAQLLTSSLFLDAYRSPTM